MGGWNGYLPPTPHFEAEECQRNALQWGVGWVWVGLCPPIKPCLGDPHKRAVADSPTCSTAVSDWPSAVGPVSHYDSAVVAVKCRRADTGVGVGAYVKAGPDTGSPAQPTPAPPPPPTKQKQVAKTTHTKHTNTNKEPP